MDLAAEGGFQLAGDAEAVEDLLVFAVMADLVGGALADLGDHVAHPVVGRDAVHDDALDVLGEEVAHGALDQVRLLEHDAGGRAPSDALLDLVPFFEQQRQVAHEVAFALAFADGAHDDAHAVGNVQFAEDFLEALAFLVIFDLARDARLVRVGQQHEVTAGEHQVGGHARAFGADRALGHLHDEVAAGRVEAGHVLLSDLGLVALAAAVALDDFNAVVHAARHDVPVMEECILLESDVHERGFQAVFEIADPAFEDAADQALFAGAFDRELLQAAFLQHRDARFERLGVDDDFLVGLLDRADQSLDLVDGLQEVLRLFLELHRLELLLHFGGRVQVRLAKVPLVQGLGVAGLRGRRAFRRKAGGDVFGALDFPGVALRLEDAFAGDGHVFVDGLGAGLLGLALLVLGGFGAMAGGLEVHAPAAAAESSWITHKSGPSMDADVLQNARGDQRAEH